MLYATVFCDVFTCLERLINSDTFDPVVRDFYCKLKVYVIIVRNIPE